jgi:RHH-type proline utilization regulon transcriptional repressor/proline dehydrogenase/delta 1-pyrroline-5-carboxylate dehydrogenase
MAYLVRRLLENTSNESFITHASEASTALLKRPLTPSPGVPGEGSFPARPNMIQPTSFPPFVNEPETDFSLEINQQAMRSEVAIVRANLGKVVPIVIDGREEISDNLVDRPDPSDSAKVASRVHYASAEQATRAVEAADRAFTGWRDTPIEQRAAVLHKVAVYFRKHRFHIAAWEVFEVGKPWREADADVAEAIDFCNYYAAEMQRLTAPRARNVPGEWNDYLYEPRGVTAVIAPWNFPLAILTGMTAAALVAGNTVVIKPAEQSSRVGLFLMEALQAAEIPTGVANFLPGDGEVVGPALVNDPRVTTIAFTGSRAVGLSIIQHAAVVQPGQRHVKRVIAEMGGKNAILIDDDADLDEAVLGVLSSATGYSGQKCSAASRVIVIGSAYEPFVAKLKDAVASLRIGPADDPATTVGPVVDADSRDRILKAIGDGKTSAKAQATLVPPPAIAERGYFVPVSLFEMTDPHHSLCQDEIFGPVIAVLRAGDLTEALKIAEDSPYGLTGGFYSRSPVNIARVRKEFRVGNLYVNRKITGAIVDRQPFGGARLSGVGAKAGGPDYLLQFVTPRTVTESVMRRGFAPTE